jgi:hypothetical protein
MVQNHLPAVLLGGFRGAEGLRARFLNLLGAFEASALNDLISLAQPTT